MYYIYHIPGKKVGVTRNLEERVTKQQGYKRGEYQILWEGTCIDLASDLEVQYQKAFGYATDLNTYKNLIKKNKMKINATEQTSTFPVPINKLKGRLMDVIGMTWETPQGYNFEITQDTIKWIMDNARVSHFNPLRTYIYNKAFHEALNNKERSGKITDCVNCDCLHTEICMSNTLDIFENIRDWADKRGIYDKGDSKTQYIKLQEEAGELAKALLNKDSAEIMDAIGDIVVVLTNLAHLEDLTIEDCIESAYDVISTRKGKMVNGTFVKETL